MKKLYHFFVILALLLSHSTCVVVAYNYRDMLCGIAHSCYSAPAWVAFLQIILFAIGIVVCLILAMVFRKKAN